MTIGHLSKNIIQILYCFLKDLLKICSNPKFPNFRAYYRFQIKIWNLQRKVRKSFILLFSLVFNLLKSFRCNFKFEFKINECSKNSEISDLSLFLNVLSRKNIKKIGQSVYWKLVPKVNNSVYSSCMWILLILSLGSQFSYSRRIKTITFGIHLWNLCKYVMHCF